MKAIWILIAASAACYAPCQKPHKAPIKSKPKIQAPSALVTKPEALAILRRTAEVARSVLHLNVAPPAFSSGTGVATRDGLVKDFGALYDFIDAKVTLTLPRIQPKLGIMTLKDPSSRDIAQRLEILGFIDPYGPLATSKAEGLTTSEFGDAIAAFVARTAEVTHTPTRKFSPYLMPP